MAEGLSSVKIPFGSQPVEALCINCGKEVTTELSLHRSACAYISCILALSVCFPCFWVPLVCSWWQDVTHICPNCKETLGMYSRFN